MSVEQSDVVKEASLPVITTELATAAIGTLPPTGFVKKMGLKEALEFFTNFVKKHDDSLMTLLRNAEKFAVQEVAPLVDRDLKNAALGRVQNRNGVETCEINPTPRVDRSGQPLVGARIVDRIEESDMDQDHKKSSHKRVKMDL